MTENTEPLEAGVTTEDGLTKITPPTNEIVDSAALANSLRSKIMGIDDSLIEKVTIPEWGDVELEFHSLTGADKAEWMAKLKFGEKASEDQTVEEKAKSLVLFVELAIYTAYYPDSNVKVFLPNDSEWLLKKSSKALSRLEDTVGKLNGFVKDTKKETPVDQAKN